jgi:predicted nucleic acid-binding Zn ribbon protein
MSFLKLMEILGQARSQYPGLSKRLDEAEALGRWEKAVGPIIMKHSRAIKVQDEVLWVEVDHPIWKSELHHRKRQILEILNQPGKSVLKDILFLDPRASSRNSGRDDPRATK